MAHARDEKLDQDAPRPVAALKDGGGRSMRIKGPVDLALFPMTDLGNAERFVERFGDDLRYTTAKGWFGWDGMRWKQLDQEDKVMPSVVLEMVFKAVRAIQEEAAALAETGVHNMFDFADDTIAKLADAGYKYTPFDDGGRDCIIQKGSKYVPLSELVRLHGRASEAVGKLRAIADLARAKLTVELDIFDNDADAINCLNGTVKFIKIGDSVTAQLIAHDRANMISKLAPVRYVEDAPASLYDEVMIWAQPEESRRRYLHQWAGYSISGHIGEQKLQFWYGKGANGKSTIIDAWAHCLGDYGGTIGIETFLDQGIKKRGDAASPDLARLGGVRMLRASEPERGAKLNEALIKAVTGGEPMAVRALHKGFFDLRPQFKLTIGGNYRPDIPGTDEGIWRRVKLVPWESYREEADRDDHLPEKLRAESEGIFARLIAGAVDWYNAGLVEPESVAAATEEYRDASDPLGRFLKTCTAADFQDRVQSSKLYLVYQAWCKAAGEYEWKPAGFSKAMLDKGFKKKTSNGVQWLGLKLTKQVGDFVDEHGNVIDQDAQAEYRADIDDLDDDDFLDR